MFALFGRNFAGTLPELAGTVGTFGLWSIFHVPLATLRRFCFHTDLPFPPQPPAPLQPTGGKQLMFALFGRNFARSCRNLSELSELLCRDQFFSFEISNNIDRGWLCHGKVHPCGIYSDTPVCNKLFSPIFFHMSKLENVPAKFRKFRKFRQVPQVPVSSGKLRKFRQVPTSSASSDNDDNLLNRRVWLRF